MGGREGGYLSSMDGRIVLPSIPTGAPLSSPPYPPPPHPSGSLSASFPTWKGRRGQPETERRPGPTAAIRQGWSTSVSGSLHSRIGETPLANSPFSGLAQNTNTLVTRPGQVGGTVECCVYLRLWVVPSTFKKV